MCDGEQRYCFTRGTVRRALGSLDRYDLLLVAIPLALVGATITAELSGLPLEAAVAVGSTVAMVAVIDGLFLNPPRGLDGV